MWTQLSSCDPNITLETLDQLKVQELVGWYIKNDYCNRTIQKQIRILKSFLRWVSRHGYTINSGVLEFKLRLKVIPRTVTFLKYKELMHFFHYEFPKEKEYLSKQGICSASWPSLLYDIQTWPHSNQLTWWMGVWISVLKRPMTNCISL